MNLQFKEYQVVELVDDLQDEDLPRGALGTIVHVYGDGAYEVEFVNDEGNELLALLALNGDQIRPEQQHTGLSSGPTMILRGFTMLRSQISSIERIIKSYRSRLRLGARKKDETTQRR